MTALRLTLAAAFAALLLAAPAAADGRPSDTGAVDRALAQERAYTQQTNPGRSIIAVDRALAQERSYQYTPTTADHAPVHTATADGGLSTALLAGSIAGLLLAATGGLAAIAVHRRHGREVAASLPGK
jgi:hypothetical protein